MAPRIHRKTAGDGVFPRSFARDCSCRRNEGSLKFVREDEVGRRADSKARNFRFICPGGFSRRDSLRKLLNFTPAIRIRRQFHLLLTPKRAPYFRYAVALGAPMDLRCWKHSRQ